MGGIIEGKKEQGTIFKRYKEGTKDKFQIPKRTNLKIFDLEERTFIFARDVRIFVSKLPKNAMNSEDFKQLIRSSGSVGANYREANDALGKKDFLYRLRISRKEAKESHYWLRLICAAISDIHQSQIQKLMNEADEIKKILSAIIIKSGG